MRWVSFVVALLVLALPSAATAATDWTEADKDGYGTSTTTRSKVWHALDDGRLTEVYFPDLGTPSVRTLEFVVSDGGRFTHRDTQARNRTTELRAPTTSSGRATSTSC